MFGTLVFIAAVAPYSSPIAEIPFRVGDDAIIMDARVNGKKLSFMFDTGFSGAFVIGPSVNVGKPTGTMMIRDFVGEFEAETIEIKSLSIGSLTIKQEGLSVIQMPTGGYTESYGQHVDGIMGLEPFKNHVMEINFENKKVLIHPEIYDISKMSSDPASGRYLVKMLPIGHNAIELVTKTDSGKRMILALDTGNSFYATTHKDVLERVGLWSTGRKVQFPASAMVASGPVETFYAKIKNLEIFGVPVPESTWSIIDLPSSSANSDGTVGFGFLKHFNITIDLKRRRVFAGELRQ